MIERGPARGPLFDAFFGAVQEAGYSLTEDVNGYRQEGFAALDRNVHDGKRLSAARAYLHPVMDRPNLDVETFALATRILSRASVRLGSSTARGRRAHQARGAEGILCGGAINSPQLLQLSGVGAAADVRSIGIPRCTICRGWGEPAGPSRGVRPAQLHAAGVDGPLLQMQNRPKVGLEWLLRKSGPGATNHFEAGGFARSNDDVEWPNLMYHFLPIAVRYDGTVPEGGGGHGYQVHVGPMYRTCAARARPCRAILASTRPFASTTSRPAMTGANGSRRSG